MDQKKYLDLPAFRKSNGLKQTDIANYLGVTPGYISLVENGSSSLSRKNIDKLYESYKWAKWDTSLLVPAMNRWWEAQRYCLEAYPDERETVLQLFDMPRTTYEKVRYAETNIPKPSIDLVCNRFPELSKEWLLSGSGDMLLFNKVEIPPSMEIIIKKLNDLDHIKTELSEIKSMLSKLYESLSSLSGTNELIRE